MARSAPRILVVDDEAAIHELLAEYLRGRGWEVEVGRSAREARALLTSVRFDVMLTDLKLTDSEGLELIRHASRRLPPVPCVVMTGFASVENVIGCLRAGASDFVVKPFKLKEILALLEAAMARARQAREQDRLARAVEFFEAAEVANDRAAALALTSQLVDTVATMEAVRFVEIRRGGTVLVQLGSPMGEPQSWSLPGAHALRVDPPTDAVQPYVLALERAMKRGAL